MLEELFKKNFINYEKLLLNIYPQLGLDEISVIILIQLIEMKLNGIDLLSINKISNKTTLSNDEIGNVLQFLINKDFIKLETKNIDGNTKEMFSIDGTISKILRLYDYNQIVEEETNKDDIIQEVISILEIELGKPLSNIQIQNVQDWIINQEYSKELIKKALKEAAKVSKVNIRYIDSILQRLKKEEVKEKPIVRDTLIADLFSKWMNENGK